MLPNLPVLVSIFLYLYFDFFPSRTSHSFDIFCSNGAEKREIKEKKSCGGDEEEKVAAS